MKHILTFCILFLVLCITSPVQSWEVYNRSTAADSDLLDGLDSTAFTLQSSFAAYTSTAGGGLGGNSFTNISVSAEAYLNEISGYDIMLQGVFGSGTSLDVAGAGTRCFFYPKSAAWRCGEVTGTQWDATNIGTYSQATGKDTTASGNLSYAEGLTTTSSGLASHAEGRDTNATASQAHAEGNNTTASFDNSHAEGNNTTSSGSASHSEGASTVASATGSHAEGGNTIASGVYSHAEGLNSDATGGYAHAEGSGTLASGISSHSGGTNTVASGLNSHAGGFVVAANAEMSFAHGSFIGISTIAINSVMFGSYSSFAERAANLLDIPDTMKLANMDLIVDKGIFFPGMITVFDNYSVTRRDYTVFAHATSNTKDLYLPDATTTEGLHIRFKKKDTTDNHVVINAVGGQNIDGSVTKVLESENNAIMVYSNGSNWEVLQATSVAHYGEMHMHDNSTATTILTANIPHLIQGLFSEEDADGYDVIVGSTGPISAFAEYSTVVAGTTKVTDVGHGLSSGSILSIAGTTSYNGIFEGTVIDVDNYYIVATFVADDATGNWYEGDKLVNSTGKSRKYKIDLHGFGVPEANNDTIEFHLYKDAVNLDNLEAKRKFTSITDVGSVGTSGLITLADGDIITLGIINISGTGDFTLEHANIVIQSF